MKSIILKVCLLLAAMLLNPLAYAQDDAQDPNAPSSPAAAPAPAYSQQQLDQMLAPIALYPDALLSQVLEAATYPLEVVQAARWSRAHPGLNGDAAVQAAKQNNWDASVISLTAFPQILQQMDDKLDWTEQLGDAFLAQQAQVMDSVQGLRQKASAAGNLQSNQQISVVTQSQTQAIVIQQAAPQVVYVPYYNPTVVYGPWWWDAYPPVYWNPWPGYAYSGVRGSFYFGSGISISAGFFYSNVDWHRRSVNIVNVNNYYYRDRHYDGRNVGRNNSQNDAQHRPPGNGPNNRPDGNPRAWQHDPDHRRGVAYPNAALQQQFSRDNSPADAQRAQRNNSGNQAGGTKPNSQQNARPDSPSGAQTGNRQRDDAGNRPNVGNDGDNGIRNNNANPSKESRGQDSRSQYPRVQDSRVQDSRIQERPDQARPDQQRQTNAGNPAEFSNNANPARAESQQRPANAVRQERPDNLQGFNNRMDNNQPRSNMQHERSIQMPANSQPRAEPAMREFNRQESPRPQAEPRGNSGNQGGERRER